MTPLWTILTLTLPTRGAFLDRLGDCLLPQLGATTQRVTWKIDVHDPAMSLGDAREKMKRDARADYISVIDDDDLVAPDYVARILPLLDGIDYVGFRLQAYEDTVPLPKPTFHSLLCGGWFESKYGYHRDISHLNPIRRELALQAPMWGGFGEDSRWASDMRALGVVKTEHYVENVMYHYLSRTDKTDGILPMTVTAGTCKACGSDATVRVGGGKVLVCNACGASYAVTWG